MLVMRGISLRIITFIGLVIKCHSEKWDHSIVLDRDGRYHVHWKTYNDSIEFKTEVRAKGYIALGLSTTGAMAGSDIVTGWVIDGVVHFQDRHGLGNFMPEIDTSQDWELLTGKENSTHTILTFRRKLQTCDKEQDVEIDEGTPRMIYAYSDEDPPSPDKLWYHSDKRGSRTVKLLTVIRSNPISTDGLAYWDVRSPNVSVPSNLHTLYWCSIIRGIDLPRKHHIVKAGPIFQPGNEKYVHHMVLYECPTPIGQEFTPEQETIGRECAYTYLPDLIGRCMGMFLLWAIGGEDLVYPEHVGLPLESHESKLYMLEVHYDIPFYHADIRDQSGLRLYYTPRLRKYDAGILEVGAAISRRLFIPPGQEEFKVVGHSHPDCMGLGMPASGVNIFATVFHSHLLGRKMKARHFRGNVELPPLGENKHYDFNFQEYTFFSKEVLLLPGDIITTECVFNSTGRQLTTFGGFSTHDEMCFTVFIYYPRSQCIFTLSVPTMPSIANLTGLPKSVHGNMSDTEFYTQMKNFEWKNISISAVEKAMLLAPHSVKCSTREARFMMPNKVTSFPPNYKAYAQVDVCLAKDPSSKTSDASTTNSPLYFAFGLQLAFIQCLFAYVTLFL